MKEIVKPLMEWYGQNARVLPWRQDATPYHVWLSEIMLQQTRVEAVKEYYRRFLERLPEVQDLAAVDEEELLKLWQGLGYYNRARNLQKAAKIICERYGGRFPQEYEEWLSLPGIGEYTAGAVVSIAFGKREPAVDGNVYRIYTRLQADETEITKTELKKRVRQEIADILPDTPGSFNQALMDLGASVCLPNGLPLCGECPLARYCQAHQAGTELEYPVKPLKKQRRVENRTIFLIEYQDKYFIQKRPDRGLLAGLWEFPGQDGHLEPEHVIRGLQDLGVSESRDGNEIALIGRAKHIFSHVEWRMLGYEIHLSHLPAQWQEMGVFTTLQDMQERYSIPSAFAFYLDYLLKKGPENESE